jgi:catechol 2,3-dioxygenase-like lactoylglutathione lyase family enzyme
MIAYATFGTNDMDRSITFYDAVFGAIGGTRLTTTPTWTVYGRDGERAKVCLTLPYDKRAALPGNGTMLAFETDSRDKVDAFHAAALAQGGSDAGLPGVREGTHYAAYVRDPEGNKLCVFAPR